MDTAGMERMRRDPYRKRTFRSRVISALVRLKREKGIRKVMRRNKIEMEADRRLAADAKLKAEAEKTGKIELSDEVSSGSFSSKLKSFMRWRRELKTEKKIRKAMKRMKIEMEARKRLEDQEKEGDSSHY